MPAPTSGPPPPTVPMKVAGKSSSVRVHLVPALRGSGVVGSPVAKKMLAFAGVADSFTCSCGHTRSKGNFMKATFEALRTTTYNTHTNHIHKQHN